MLMTFDLQTGRADTGAEAPSWLPVTGDKRREERTEEKTKKERKTICSCCSVYLSTAEIVFGRYHIKVQRHEHYRNYSYIKCLGLTENYRFYSLRKDFIQLLLEGIFKPTYSPLFQTDDWSVSEGKHSKAYYQCDASTSDQSSQNADTFDFLVFKIQKIVRNVHHKFSEQKVTTSQCFNHLCEIVTS